MSNSCYSRSSSYTNARYKLKVCSWNKKP